MPQPPLALKKYLSTPLPTVRENFPAGGGATGERKEYDTKLKGVSIVEDFNDKVVAFTKTLPDQAVSAHPAHPFPQFLTVLPGLPKEVKAAQDVQQYLRQLPLAATSATLCALTGVEQSLDYVSAKPGNQTLDAAGYESDGGETPATLAAQAKDSNDAEHHEEEGDAGKTEAGHLSVPGPSWGWKFAKSPLGSGEFLLIDEKEPEKVLLVVRTINKTAFSAADWSEYVYEGPYHYNIKSKASWYHSRNYRATKRLGCRYFIFTDYQRWLFGVFSEDRTHLNITPIITATSTGPSVLEALVYWTKSALDQGSSGGYKAVVKDVQGKPAPFEGDAAGKKAGKETGVSVGAESDIEE